MRCGHCQEYLTEATSKAYCLHCGTLLCTSCAKDTSHSETSTDDFIRNVNEQGEQLSSTLCREGEAELTGDIKSFQNIATEEEHTEIDRLCSAAGVWEVDSSEILDKSNVYTERVSEKVYHRRDTIERKKEEFKTNQNLSGGNKTLEKSASVELLKSNESEKKDEHLNEAFNSDMTLDERGPILSSEKQGFDSLLKTSTKLSDDDFSSVTVALEVPLENWSQSAGRNTETHLKLTQGVSENLAEKELDLFNEQESGYGSQTLTGSNEMLLNELKDAHSNLSSFKVTAKTAESCSVISEVGINTQTDITQDMPTQKNPVTDELRNKYSPAGISENTAPVVMRRSKKINTERFVKRHSRSSSLPDLLKSSIERRSALITSNEQLSKSTVDLLEDGEKDKAPLQAPFQLCDKDHKATPKYMCFKDNEIYCKVCVEVHNLHCKEKVKYIPEIPPETRSKVCEDSLMDLLSAKERFQKVKEEISADFQLLKDSRKEYVRSVLRFKQKMVNLIDKIEKEALADMDLIYNIEHDKFQKSLDKLESCIRDIEKLLAAVKIQESDEDNSILYKIQKASKSVTGYELDLHEIHRSCFKTEFLFQPLDTVSSVLSSKEELWTIKLTKDVKCRTPYPCTCDRSFKYRKPEFERQFSAKISRWSFDKDKCYISGCEFLDNGNLLLADNHNKKIKLFDKKYKCISALHLSSLPWDLTTIDSHLAVVSIPDKKQLQFFEANSKLSLKHSVILEKNCWGVARAKDLLVVTCWSRDTSEILVMDTNGGIRHTIAAVDRTPFNMPWYVSATSDVICVSDWGSNNVTFFTQTGKLLNQYSDQDLTGAMGIFADPEGNVYVCGRDTNNIHQVSLNGGKVKTILTDRDGVEKPVCVCHCPLDNRLVVTSWMSDTVQVFRLV